MRTLDWKGREAFSEVRVPEDWPVVVRVDGWNFRSLSEDLGLRRPYDERLIQAMVSAGRTVMKSGLPILIAYTFSDEISYVLPPPLPFSGRVEKLVTLTASLTASRVALELAQRFSRPAQVAFDGRIVLLKSLSEVPSYLSWRQSEAWRNLVNSYALWALESVEGLSRSEAARRLRGMRARELHEISFRLLGVNPARTPGWQRRGVLLYWRREKRVGANPLTGERVETVRRVLTEDWEPPLFSSPEGRGFLREVLGL